MKKKQVFIQRGFSIKVKQLFGKSFAILLLLALFQLPAAARQDPPIVKVLDGNLGQLVDTVITIEDTKYFDPGYEGLLMEGYPTISMVWLELNENLNETIPEDFNFTVTVNITYTLADSSTFSINDIPLNLNYDDQAPYTFKHTQVYHNVYRVTVEVTDVDDDGASFNATKFVKLVNQLQTSPQYVFSCTGNVITAIFDSAWAADTNKDELPVYWSPVMGANEYDLEWTYIDSSAFAGGRYGDTSNLNADLLFDNNASRVTITGTIYNIPLIYDNKGHLFFRVRAVQWPPYDSVQGITPAGRNESNWSSVNMPGGLGRFDFNGHERTLNWQATTTFAEDGKRKTVVQYYDGSLRARQTVTKDNSTNQTIVAESFYDYQGRPVIQVLPAPTLNSIIGYTQNFNRGINGSPYEKSLYDSLASPGDYCDNGADSMSVTGGAAQYYSPNNPLVDSGFHQYIPNAEGFPFTEVQYTQDNTGRISRQSGVGKTFKIGGGHETRYFYGTPDQRELDALFGTEVGHYSHYFKTMVRDANGQYSVSYTDMRGRTVATALAGVPADTATIKLDTLASYTSATRTEVLSDPASTVIKDLVMENKKGLLVSKAGNYTFNYQLNPQSLMKEGCDSVNVCYECLYDLQIIITDDCNNQKLGGAPFDTLVQNFSIGAIDTSCTGSGGFSFTFTKYLEEGSYEITKRLSVSRYAMDFYRDSFFIPDNSCKNLDSFLLEQRNLLAAVLDCKPTCQSCTDSLGTWEEFRVRFMTGSGIAEADTAGYRDLAMQAFLQAQEDCAQLCDTAVSEYEDIRKAMLMDMTPSSGQYANIDNSDDLLSIFFQSADGENGDDTLAIYRGITNYTDPDGSPALVFDEGSGKLVPPQELTSELFARNFKISWAEALLPHHPEYCKLQKYELLQASHDWNKRFEAVDSYEEAMDKGYLNPINEGSFPNHLDGEPGMLDVDPLDAAQSGTFHSQLVNAITSYKSVSGLGTISLWGVACVTVKCEGADTDCYNTYQNTANVFNTDSLCAGELDMAWRAFRQLYLDIKRNIINDWLTSECNTDLSAADLVAAGHSPHFSDAEELLDAGGVDFPTNQTEANAFQDQYGDSVAAYYEANCNAYIELWLQQLGSCTLYHPDSLSTVIIPRLIEVCKEGSDEGHPYGASSVKPSSVYTYTSFEAVLEDYNQTHGITDTGNCNAYGITAPKPYNQQTVYSSKPLYTAPDSCECATFNSYYASYQLAVGSGQFSSFADYLKKVYNTFMKDTALSVLVNYCQEGGPDPGTCPFLETGLYLPPLFQCYTGDICVSCAVFDSLDIEFRNKYPNVNPSVSDTAITDSVLLGYNRLYEQFMNYRLGFVKTYDEYAAFAAQCKTTLTTLACDSLQQLVSDFKTGRQDYGVETDYSTVEGYHFNNLENIVRDGVIQLPDSLRYILDTTGHNYITTMQKGGIDFCWNNGYAIEYKVKFLYNMPTRFLINTLNCSIDFYRATESFTANAVNYGPGFYLSSLEDNHSNAYGADNGFNEFGYALCSADPHILKNWDTVKLQVAKSHYSVYFNGVLVQTIARDTTLTISNSKEFQMGFWGQQGTVDWIKMYDANDQVRYFEDFLDIENPIKVDNGFLCPDSLGDCTSAFVDYFNLQKGTSYSYSEIDSIYQATCGLPLNPCPDTLTNKLTWLKNEFLNNYYNHGRKYDDEGCDIKTWGVNYDGTFSSLPINYGRVFSGGVMQYPDTLGQPPVGTTVDFDFVGRDSACVERNFSLEFRMRQKTFVNLYMEIWFGFSPTKKFYIRFNANTLSSNYCHYYDYSSTENSREHFNISAFQQDYSDWREIKFEIIDTTLHIYVDGQVQDTLYYPPGITLEKFYGFGFGSYGNNELGAEFDWVKAYDKNGKLFYFEDFNSCSNFSFFAPFIRCPKPSCTDAFTSYYNQQQQTSYNFTQLDSLYAANNLPLNICDSASPYITLCGRAEPVYAPTALDTVDNCTDSTFFVVSNAQELYNIYTDSLKQYFDSAYRATCLQAYKMETFTVRHEVSEYHYTLYYYDQAGNLVKTVPPAGVQANYDSLWLDSIKTARLEGTVKVPVHTLITQYRYNTLNQVVSQQSPDGGKTDFWYDRLGRLVLSRNARQLAASSAGNNYYSYTRYDVLGRITEVGQVADSSAATPVDESFTRNETALGSWFTSLANYRGQVTQTIYDIAYNGFGGFDNKQVVQQQNLRNRVSFVTLTDSPGISTAYNNATFYSYDIHGNVDTLLQDYGQTSFVPNFMNKNGNRFKKFVYKYDLISGKVNMVMYQRGWSDQWFHRYMYDAENRLTDVETSLDSLTWEKEAHYEYYRHGPLARMTIGQQQVQGMDYAYTLQGWLKGVNSTGATIAYDMGGDGKGNGMHQFTARDAYGYTLNYFTGDYSAISNLMPFPGYSAYLDSVGVYRPLFNGNISSMSTYNRRFEDVEEVAGGPILFHNYRYDQLNRLTGMDTYRGFDTLNNWWMGMEANDDYMTERVAYDGNGNILKYFRTAMSGFSPDMDSLNYYYIPGTNQLRRITDNIEDDAYKFSVDQLGQDIDNQPENNYAYDAIGNLVKDSAEGISNIKWSVYGKILEITRSATETVPVTNIKYTYDAQGNRISKLYDVGGTKTYTWYVRDAQGNLMSTYTATGNDTALQNLQVGLTERYIYGSSRLGMYTDPVDVDNSNAGPISMENYSGDMFVRGLRQYELTNHLGNVLAVITDKKFGVPSDTNSSLIAYYEPHIITAFDYYPFGMMSRMWYDSDYPNYRFGFNGKEMDHEAKGNFAQLDYGMRIYDPRAGRFLSVDPLTRQFAYYTPYQFAGNSPIAFIDLDGGEPTSFIKNWKNKQLYNLNTGQKINDNGGFSITIEDPKLGYVDVELIYDSWKNQLFFVHQGNDGQHYYLKNDNGDHSVLTLKGGTIEIIGGHLEPFETQDRIQAKLGAKFADGLAVFFSAAFSAPFIWAAIAEGGAALWGTVETQVLNTIARSVLTYWKYAPAIGKFGLKMAEFLDESGSVGAQNRSIKSLAVTATKNSSSTKVLLGKFVKGSAESYNTRAGKEFTYFQLDNWDEVLKSFGNDVREMWKINKQFLSDQIDAGKDIFFSHDPSKATGYFLNEVNYLKERGFNTFKKVGENLWQAIKE